MTQRQKDTETNRKKKDTERDIEKKGGKEEKHKRKVSQYELLLLIV